MHRYLLLALALAGSTFATEQKATPAFSLETYKASIDKLPKANPSKGMAGIPLNSLISTIKHAQAILNQELMRSGHWLNNDTPFTINGSKPAYPFCQKIILPQGSIIAFFGDLHGNLHGFLNILYDLQQKKLLDAQLNIINPNFYLFFLGDYVDRGDYGAEIMYLLALLKQNNPHKEIGRAHV